MTYAIAVVGYPSSGKSVAKEIAEELGYETIVMGNKVREKTQEQWGDKLEYAKQDDTDMIPSDVYGDFATEMRSQNGQGIVAEWCKDDILDVDDPVFIDGMRSPASKRTFEQYIDLDLLFIHAPASIRLEWIKNRGRDYEDQFNATKLLDRDRKENNWGLNDTISMSDYTIHNCGSFEDYKNEVRALLEEKLDQKS